MMLLMVQQLMLLEIVVLMVWLEELKRIVLSLPFEDFSSKFFIGYIPNGKEERPSNLVHLGEIDIS